MRQSVIEWALLVVIVVTLAATGFWLLGLPVECLYGRMP